MSLDSPLAPPQADPQLLVTRLVLDAAASVFHKAFPITEESLASIGFTAPEGLMGVMTLPLPCQWQTEEDVAAVDSNLHHPCSLRLHHDGNNEWHAEIWNYCEPAEGVEEIDQGVSLPRRLRQQWEVVALVQLLRG